jgi:hypothetical protein
MLAHHSKETNINPQDRNERNDLHDMNERMIDPILAVSGHTTAEADRHRPDNLRWKIWPVPMQFGLLPMEFSAPSQSDREDISSGHSQKRHVCETARPEAHSRIARFRRANYAVCEDGVDGLSSSDPVPNGISSRYSPLSGSTSLSRAPFIVKRLLLWVICSNSFLIVLRYCISTSLPTLFQALTDKLSAERLLREYPLILTKV